MKSLMASTMFSALTELPAPRGRFTSADVRSWGKKEEFVVFRSRVRLDILAVKPLQKK